MTEEEAKTKWCHRSFEPESYRIGSGGSHTVIASKFSMYCVGSACMAWRWSDEFKTSAAKEASTINGFCGLASKP